MYLFAVIDWHSRRMVAWRLSNTLGTDFCLEAVTEVTSRHGVQKLFNTDQGRQFTGAELTGLLLKHGIQISMDGNGRWVVVRIPDTSTRYIFVRTKPNV